MPGLDFYIYLQTVLTENDVVSLPDEYRFIKWMDKGRHVGGLQFLINERQHKTIPPEMIIRAYEDFNNQIPINLDWVREHGQDNWCFPAVLNHIFLL